MKYEVKLYKHLKKNNVTCTLLIIIIDFRKKVVIKVPSRIKHIYHQHTQKVHIHKHPKKISKPKPKPVVKVVKIQEEIKWKPDWKDNQWKPKIHEGRNRKDNQNWKETRGYEQTFKPKGFVVTKGKDEKRNSYEESGAEESKIHKDYYGVMKGWKQDNDFSEDLEHLARDHFEDLMDGRERKVSGSRGGRGNKERIHKKKCDYEEESHEVQEDWGSFNPTNYRSNGKKRGQPHRDQKPRSRRPYLINDKYEGSEIFEDSYSKDSIWPERREHPSWHKKDGENTKWSIPVAEHTDDWDQKPKESSSKFSQISFDDFINSSEFVPSSDYYGSSWNGKSDYFPQSSSIESGHEAVRKNALSIPLSAYFNGEITEQSLTGKSPQNFDNNDHLNPSVQKIIIAPFNEGPHRSLPNLVQPFYNTDLINNNQGKRHYNDSFGMSSTSNTPDFYNYLQPNNQQDANHSYHLMNTNKPGNTDYSKEQISNSGTNNFPSYSKDSNKKSTHGILSSSTGLYHATPASKYNPLQPTTPEYHSNNGVQTSEYRDATLMPRLNPSRYRTQTKNKSDGFSVVYQSKIGHRTNGTGLSSSYQEVNFGKRINSDQT